MQTLNQSKCVYMAGSVKKSLRCQDLLTLEKGRGGGDTNRKREAGLWMSGGRGSVGGWGGGGGEGCGIVFVFF